MQCVHFVPNAENRKRLPHDLSDRVIAPPCCPDVVTGSPPSSPPPQSQPHRTAEPSAPTSLSMPSRRRTSPRRAALTRHPGAPAAVSAARNGLGAPRPRLPRRLAAAGPWRCRARRDGTAGRRVRGSKTVLCLEGPDLLPALPRHFIHCSCFLFKAVLALPLPFQRLTRLILQAGQVKQTSVSHRNGEDSAKASAAFCFVQNLLEGVTKGVKSCKRC